jgi:hypothetical protein
MPKKGVINSRHREAVIQYYLELDETQQDYLSIPNSTLNTDVASTGNWAYGGRITVPTVNPSSVYGLFGKTRFFNADSNYGVWLTSSGGLVVNNRQVFYTTSNFIANYGNQTIDLKIQYEVLDIVVYVNDIEINRFAIPSRPTLNANKTFFIGAYGDSNGLSPQSGRYFNGRIHSFLIDDNIWGVNEGSGNQSISKIGNYVAGIFTSNLDPNYIDDFMWQLLNP